MQWFTSRSAPTQQQGSHPGTPAVRDGSAAVVHSERAAGSVGALPGRGAAGRAARLWQEEGPAAGEGGDPPPRCSHAGSEPEALATAAGMAEAGLRATAFLSGEGLTAAHSLLYGIAGKRLPLVVHLAAQAAPRPGWSEGAGHDAYHAVADAGWFQFFAWDAQSAADLTLIARRLAEQALLPGLLAQDAWLTTHRAGTLSLPEAALAREFLGAPADEIACPTPAQRLLFGERRRRVPPVWSVDAPLLSGAAHGADTYAEAAAAQALFAQAHLADLADEAMDAFAALSGRRYAAVQPYRCDDAEYVIVAQGSAVPTAQAVADHLRKQHRVGVVNLAMLRPFPGAALAGLLLGRRGVLVLERMAPPHAGDAPLLAEVRAALHRTAENATARRGPAPHADYPRARRLEDLPPLTSGVYGLGGRDLHAGDLRAAVEDLTPAGAGRRRLWLGVDFAPRGPLTPKQEIVAQQLADAYPGLAGLAVRQEAAPALLPPDARVLRVYGAAGRMPFTCDDHAGSTLHEVAGLHVQAWPAPARVRRGNPTAFTVVAARSPLPAAGEPERVDVAVVTDPLALRDPALAADLAPGGVLLLVPEEDTPTRLWAAVPQTLRDALQRGAPQVQWFPGYALAREEAREPEEQRHALSLLLQGALLACPPLATLTGLQGKALVRELKSALLRRYPQADAADVEAELALLRQGSEALRVLAPPEPEEAPARSVAPAAKPALAAAGLRDLQPHPVPAYDLHRFGESRPAAADGAGVAMGVEPFAGAGVLPAATGLLRDQSACRSSEPHWLPVRCTGCGACWAVCPDAALPGLVNTAAELLEAGVRLLERRGTPTEQLPRAVRVLESKWRERLGRAGPGADVGASLAAAVEDTLPAVKVTADEREALAGQLEQLRAACQPFPLAITAPFFAEPEAAARGSGGLLSITLDPAACKGCGACVQACPEQALEQRPQTPEALAELRERWAFWERLPTSGEAFLRLGDTRGEPPTLETGLLDKRIYRAVVGGHDADAGSAAATALHLFAAAAQALLQPRLAEHAARLEQLIERLEAHLRQQLAVDVSDVEALGRAVRAAGEGDLTLSELSRQVDRDGTPIDTAWLARATGTLAGLKRLHRRIVQGEGGHPRSGMGLVAALDAELAALVPAPFNAFAVPFSAQPADGAVGALEGVAEGHLARMAKDFRLVRIAELELDGKYNAEVHDAFFARFGWRDFTAEEWQLCPPVALLGGDAGLARHGASGVLALLRGGRPLKVLCLDGQAWRGLAAQPGTATAFGEADAGTGDEAPLGGPAGASLALLGIAQGAAYVEQGSLADIPRLLDGFRRGLASQRPALFSVFAAHLPAHGRADALAVEQARLALACRAHPALRYDPDAGETLHQRLTLAGNPAPEQPWAPRSLEHLDDAGHGGTLDVPGTFADFALAVPELQHHFAPAPAGDEALTALDEYLGLDGEERRETRPFVWAVDHAGTPRRWVVSAALVRATEQHRERWRLLRALTREDIVPVDEAAIAEQARGEMVDTVWRQLIELAQGDGEAVAESLSALAEPGTPGPGGPTHA